MHRPVRLEKPKELAVTVEEFEPPRRMRLRQKDDDGVFDVTYELEATAAGTRLTQRDEIEWRIPRFQLPIARYMVSRDVERQLATLRRLLESNWCHAFALLRVPMRAAPSRPRSLPSSTNGAVCGTSRQWVIAAAPGGAGAAADGVDARVADCGLEAEPAAPLGRCGRPQLTAARPVRRPRRTLLVVRGERLLALAGRLLRHEAAARVVRHTAQQCEAPRASRVGAMGMDATVEPAIRRQPPSGRSSGACGEHARS